MRRIPALFLTAVFALMLYAPAAHAQYGSLPNQASWNDYLRNHPKTAAEIQANPSVIYNPNWRTGHPHFEQWANNHPGDWKMMRAPAPWQAQYGAWYDDDQWHDSDWYYHNHPNWAHEHHPEWWQEHKDWQAWKHEEAEEKHEAKEKHEEAHNWKHHHHDND